MTTKTSKFAAVLAAKNGTQNDETNEVPSVPQKPTETQPARNVRVLADVSSNGAPTITRRVGRPNAKRSDPDFVQTTAYIKKQTHRDVKISLLVEGQEREYSELIEDLLADWLKSKR